MKDETILQALKTVKYPGFSRDIVSFGLIKDITWSSEGEAKISLSITTADASIPAQLKKSVEECLASIEGLKSEVAIAVSKPKTNTPGEANSPQSSAGASQLANVKKIIAVASGKGGVGKSTFAVNLACAIDYHLRNQGIAKGVGIMDCDIYGPSVPLMIGAQGRPDIEDQTMQPLENFGIRVMSMGLLIDSHTPVVWRGPMIMKTIQQFGTHVNWGNLEYLIIDLPPGTGDAQLSLTQTLPLDGAVIVTTPQQAAADVATRGAMMFPKVNVPFIGVVENMSYFENPATQEKECIFGEGGGQRTADQLETDLLGSIPLDMNIRQGSDNGIPIIISDPTSSSAQRILDIAASVIEKTTTPEKHLA